MLDKIDVLKLYNKFGLSANEIAQKYNISVWRVISFMRRNKIKRRKPSETIKIQFERSPLSFKRINKLDINLQKLLLKLKTNHCLLYFYQHKYNN